MPLLMMPFLFGGGGGGGGAGPGFPVSLLSAGYDDGIMPAAWFFDIDLVIAESQWFWRDKNPQLVVPFWVPGAVNLVDGALGTDVGGPTFESGPHGPRKVFDASGEYVSTGKVIDPAIPITFIAYVEDTTALTGSQFNFYLSLGQSGSGNDYVAIASHGTLGYRYLFRSGGNTADGTNFAVAQGGAQTKAPALIIGTSRAADDHEIFVEGVSIDTSSATVNPGNIIEDFTDIGRLGDSSPAYSLSAGVKWVAICKSDFSADEAKMLAAYPLGPFTMNL